MNLLRSEPNPNLKFFTFTEPEPNPNLGFVKLTEPNPNLKTGTNPGSNYIDDTLLFVLLYLDFN